MSHAKRAKILAGQAIKKEATKSKSTEVEIASNEYPILTIFCIFMGNCLELCYYVTSTKSKICESTENCKTCKHFFLPKLSFICTP